jgi:bla regulator protein BlaR1
MTANYLSGISGPIALGLGNHLWQSTFFAFVVILLTLALRKNHARTRYWLWLAASVKFLIPFSLLVILGSHLAWLHPPLQRLTTETNAGSYLVIEEMSQPFMQATDPSAAALPPAVSKGRLSIIARMAVFLNPLPILPVLLAIVWLCGSMVVLGRWTVRWTRISRAMRHVASLQEGREVDALRRMERLGGLRRPIELRVLPASTEPGIFGFVRPVLVWPHAISARLDDEHLDAVLAHEVCHVLRRDNLTSVIHMFVEAIFWFHPLVWWMERKLVEEREYACDEDVLGRFRKPQVYAEGILKVCEFCVESSLTCVSGITGADLKKRVMHIMTGATARNLGFGGKCLLAFAGLTTLFVPLMVGQIKTPRSLTIFPPNQPKVSTANSPSTILRPAANATGLISQASIPQSPAIPSPTVRQPSVIVPTPAIPEWQTAAGGKMSFEVASVRQNKTGGKSSMNVDPTNGNSFTPTGGLYVAKNIALAEFVAFAYKLTNRQLGTFESRVPWSLNDLFDIEARADGNPTKDQYRLMMQSLLAERFKLAMHFETREIPVHALVLVKPGKLGPQLRLHRADDPICATNAPIPKPGRGGSAADADGFPLAVCGATVRMVPSAPGRSKGGGRDIPMTLLADKLGGFGADRPVVDETGIRGNVDYSLESQLQDANLVPGQTSNSDDSAPDFDEALKEQLGIKMVSQKGPAEFFVVDHIEHPSPN